MANRASETDLPPNSLISLTHYLANFLSPIYSIGLKDEIMDLEVVFSDETTHRMLEGDDQKRWYLWGFSGPETAYFEYRDTRSGDVASEVLMKCKAKALLSDAFSGYSKTIRLINEMRQKDNILEIKQALCNAHSRRKFDEAVNFEESKYYIKQYARIYRLEKTAKIDKSKKTRTRNISKTIFQKMKKRAEKDLKNISSHSDLARAINYFIKYYDGLTIHTDFPEIPIDNNSQEKLFRSPVVGRKTWYGTHSKKGANTAAILFSLVESCKLVKINPRVYFKDMVEMIHTKGTWMTPSKYKEFIKSTKIP